MAKLGLNDIQYNTRGLCILVSEKDENVALVMMTLMTAYSALAELFRQSNPDDRASEELCESIRNALKGLHSDNTMNDLEELRAVETTLAIFDAILKPQLFAGYTGGAPKLPL